MEEIIEEGEWLSERIAMLEAQKELTVVQLSANLEQRIAALENARATDVGVWEGELAHLRGRIAALETELRDFGAWALEIFGPIGPPGGGRGIEARIAKLEQCALREINFSLDRMATLEDTVLRRIATLEAKMSRTPVSME